MKALFSLCALGPTLAMLSACDAAPDEGGQALAWAEAEAGAASDADQIEAVGQWADRAPIVALIDIEAATASEGDDHRIVTAATLVVREMYRDDLDVGLASGDRVWMEVPGGELGEVSELSSQAPLLVEGDTVLAALTVNAEGELIFDSHNSVLPVRDGAVAVCVNPDQDAIRRCVDAQRGVVVLEELPSFVRADDGPALPLAQATPRLR